MLTEWTSLSPQIQMMLNREALHRAVDRIAGQAETLAREMESGALVDRGGPDALRLLAALVRASEWSDAIPAGHA